ncbi:MAG: hypothetical protein HQL39_10490 [Alphaproteobacteria bacterium]|nr:hypothetical protein [Alphaproteobacteria bacterium]
MTDVPSNTGNTLERRAFIEECLALMPKLEAGLSACRSSAIVHPESHPSSIVRFMANGATAHALTDLACFATAFEAALLHGEAVGWTDSLTEVSEKSIAMLSLHLEVATAGGTWNSDWDIDLVADLMIAASSPRHPGTATGVTFPVGAPFSPQISQVQYHKQNTSFWDGRESLFLKLWSVLSRTAVAWLSVETSKPTNMVKRPKKAGRSRGEEDPILEALR